MSVSLSYVDLYPNVLYIISYIILLICNTFWTSLDYNIFLQNYNVLICKRKHSETNTPIQPINPSLDAPSVDP